MTDNEIIKALDFCGGYNGVSFCSDCSLINEDNCTQTLSREALDLIKRQKDRVQELEIEHQAMRNAANGYKAETERLYRIIAVKDYSFAEVTSALRLAKKLLETEKSEAIKEFADRLQSTLDKRLGDDIPILGDRDNVYCTVSDIYDVIDNLVKKMMEAER